MKITKKPWFIAMLCMVLIVGCEPSPNADNTGTSTDTNAVNVGSTNESIPPLFSANASTKDPKRDVLDQRAMQVKLTTELSQNNKVVNLSRGLYFFVQNESEAFDAISSFLHEHTNMVPVAVFSARENNDNKYWFTGNSYISLQDFPYALNISNGMFAVFRDR